jgi:integrase
LRACIEVALETGLRRSEILGLRWRDVHEAEGLILLPGAVAKTGADRVVIISPRLSAILDMRRTEQRTAREITDPDESLPSQLHPFGNELGERVKGFKTAWKLTCKRAGIVGLTFRDLRREFGSRALEAGVTLTDVRDLLGHASVTMTNTYLATTAKRLKDAIAKMDAARTPLAHAPDQPEVASEHSLLTH